LVVAEVRQAPLDEVVELLQGLGSVNGPAKGRGLRFTQGLDPCRLDDLPQGAVVMARTGVGWLSRLAGPGLSVVGIKIPLTAFWLAVWRQQNLVTSSLVAIEIFHQPLFFSQKQLLGLVTLGKKVLAVHHAHRDRAGWHPVAQGLVQPPFVRRLVLDGVDLVVLNQCIQVHHHILAIAGVVDADVAHPMSVDFELLRKVAHGSKEAQDFLRMMKHIVGFRAHFHQDIDNVGLDCMKPAVLRVELIAQDEA
jgi:hypothetical protein